MSASMSFTDDRDLAVLQGALWLAADEWSEMSDGDDDASLDFAADAERAQRLLRRVQRARQRLAT